MQRLSLRLSCLDLDASGIPLSSETHDLRERQLGIDADARPIMMSELARTDFDLDDGYRAIGGFHGELRMDHAAPDQRDQERDR